MEFSSILKAFNSVEEATFYFLGERKQVAGPVSSPRTVSSDKMPPSDKKPASVTIDKKNVTIESVSEESAIEDLSSAVVDENEVFMKKEFKRNISQLIYDRPFLSIKEIVQTLKLPEYGGVARKKREVIERLKKFASSLP